MNFVNMVYFHYRAYFNEIKWREQRVLSKIQIRNNKLFLPDKGECEIFLIQFLEIFKMFIYKPSPKYLR